MLSRRDVSLCTNKQNTNIHIYPFFPFRNVFAFVFFFSFGLIRIILCSVDRTSSIICTLFDTVMCLGEEKSSGLSPSVGKHLHLVVKISKNCCYRKGYGNYCAILPSIDYPLSA